MPSPFRRKASGPRLERPQAERQGRITTLAFTQLGRDEAIRFLNSHADSLGGRPIDVAIASEEGLAAVTEALELVAQG